MATTAHRVKIELTTAATERGDTQSRVRAERIVQLDRQFAWITQVLPLTGTAAALGLHLAGLRAGGREFALLVVMYALVTGAQEVGWHRHFAHRSFETARPVAWLLAVLGSMSFQGPLIWWVATHRRHHGFSDRPGDPHSPRSAGPGMYARLCGLYEGHTGWTFDALRARPVGWSQYAKDLYRDEMLFRVHYQYFAWMVLGLALPATIGGLLARSATGALLGLLWGGFVRIFIADHCVRALNSVAHTYGTRTFDTDDLSRNNPWLVIPTFGQGWHHNHHAFPTSATTSFFWYQIDPGSWVIKALMGLGLAWNVKCARREALLGNRAQRTVDREMATTTSDG